jgi:hypothetical protein
MSPAKNAAIGSGRLDMRYQLYPPELNSVSNETRGTIFSCAQAPNFYLALFRWGRRCIRWLAQLGCRPGQHLAQKPKGHDGR